MQVLNGHHIDERGSVLIIALLVLMLLTIIGVAATTTSEIELKISGNEKSHRLAFYAAEAARAYVAKHGELYGPDNLSPGAGIDFPNKDDPSEKYPLGPHQAFKGRVEYLGSSVVPRGSGTQAGAFRVHRYRMTCEGYGPSNAKTRIEAGFYRVGYE